MTATSRIVARALCMSDSDKFRKRHASHDGVGCVRSTVCRTGTDGLPFEGLELFLGMEPPCLKPVQERPGNGRRIAQGESGCENEDARDGQACLQGIQRLQDGSRPSPESQTRKPAKTVDSNAIKAMHTMPERRRGS